MNLRTFRPRYFVRRVGQIVYRSRHPGVPWLSPGAGSVVRDGQDGYIVSIRDVDAIVERLERLAADTELRRTLGASGMQRVAEFTVARYGARLIAALKSEIQEPI